MIDVGSGGFEMIKTCKRCGKQKNMMSWEAYCFQCLKEIELEKVQQSIKAGDPNPDTFSTDYMICPCCGAAYEQLSYDETQEMYDEGEHEVECYECGEIFKLCTNISYSWETSKMPN